MFIFLKDLAILGISLFTAILASIGVPTEPAPVPISEFPLIIIDEGNRETQNEDAQEEDSTIDVGLSQESVPTQSADDEPIEEDPPQNEDPFKEVADAFAQLAEDTTSQVTPLTASGVDLNTFARSALVNVFCTTRVPGGVALNSGSGVVITPSGVVLTNAHVAQQLLLQNYPSPGATNCILRSKNPAEPAYSVELLFISPSWVRDNAHSIDDETPLGNGEHDYALLRITGALTEEFVTEDPLPYLPIALHAPDRGTEVLIAGYPAGFLGSVALQNNLFASSARTKIAEIYTYGAQTIDFISLGGSVVAQLGSSGGPVVREDGALVGLIVTTTAAAETGKRDLHAITTEYIIRDFENEFGVSLAAFLGSDLDQQALNFRLNTAPLLSAELIAELEN